jgi:ATP-dependent RNA helicase RhlE
MEFSDLGLVDVLLEKCESLGFVEPTPIQKKAIPIVLKGVDLIGCAETGTGKTAAFLLPTIQKIISQKKSGVSVLIVAPTRELVTQISEAYIQLASKKMRCVNLIGGASMNKQLNALRRGVSVIIATPGRLIDHIDRGSVNLANVDTLILDEADRMLDMGFLPAIKRILKGLSDDRQTLLFSATVSDSIKSLAYSIMNKPKVVEVSRKNVTARTVKQISYSVAAASKTPFLIDFLEKRDYERIIIFTRTKRGADRLAHILAARGFKANRLHSNLSQSRRERELKAFRDGKTKILVATDIASRGIDVESISYVINYDVPEPAEDYVHRIGRTGRAGNQGEAITMVTPIDELKMRDIEKLINQKIKRVISSEFGGAAPIYGRELGNKKKTRGFRGRRSSRPRRRR